MKLRISIEKISLEVELADTPTATAILRKLPFQSKAQTWGDEVYFSAPVSAKLAAPCNVLGKILGDPKALSGVRSGDAVKIEKV